MYLRRRISIVSVIVALLILACDSKDANTSQQSTKNAPLEATGVKSTNFDVSDYNKAFYVDISSEVATENGTKEAPFHSISQAVRKCNAGDNTAIVIATGSYSEGTIQLKEGNTLLGGFNPTDWTRNISKYETILSGKDQERILVAANNTNIDGFIFTKGIFRGTGAAIYCNGTSPTITNNVFTGNMVLKPLDWNPEFWHETAHNGGAIYGENGASPTIMNNVFLDNKTENGRGAAIAFDTKCKVIINNNVFVNNIAGLDDPMRSSDGGAISIFDWCDAEINNNIFIGNKALARNDGGAVFVALWSSANIHNNILVDSESGDDAGALFVGGQEHRYDGPLDPIPSKKEFYVTVDSNQFYGNRNSSMNSGAMRFTMESRGEFTNNRLAYNNGVYFQRSEVAVTNNIILDNFLFIETKEGLKQSSIENNVIWGDFELTTPAKVSGNIIRDGYEGGENNSIGTPGFEDDGKRIQIVSTIFNRKRLSTRLYALNIKYRENELVNRIVKIGNNWGVVQSNSESEIIVWGNLFGAESIQLLPTYTILKQ